LKVNYRLSGMIILNRSSLRREKSSVKISKIDLNYAG